VIPAWVLREIGPLQCSIGNIGDMRRILQIFLAVILATQSIWLAASDVCHHEPGAQPQQAHTHHPKAPSHHPYKSVDGGSLTPSDTLQDCGGCHLAHLSVSLVESAVFEVLAVKGEVPRSLSVGAMPSPLYSIDRPNWIS
jgi:hypothetical protein